MAMLELKDLKAPETLYDLPSPNTKYWTPIRKALVLLGVRSGIISRTEALAHYDLGEEEFAEWERRVQRSKISGLRVTRRDPSIHLF